jgi:hypothetical protein
MTWSGCAATGQALAGVEKLERDDLAREHTAAGRRRSRKEWRGGRKDPREVGRVIPNAPFRMAARPEAAD